MSFLSILVGVNSSMVKLCFDVVVVVLRSDIHPDLTPKDREVKRRLGKCHPRAYSDLIKSDLPSSSRVSPSSSPRLKSPSLPAMETSPGGPLVVKPTQGELQARVELLAKKKRSIKRRAQDPPMGSLPDRGKVPKLGVSNPRSQAQVKVRGQAWSSSAEVSEVASAQHHSSSVAEVKGSSRKAAYLFLEPFGAKRLTFPPPPPPPPRHREMREMIALKLRGVRTRYSPMRSSPSGLSRLFFGTLISRK